MANIKAFRALRPDHSMVGSLLASGQPDMLSGKIKAFKDLLEPCRATRHEKGNMDRFKANLEKLIYSGIYNLQAEEAIYVYEQDTPSGKQYGLWVLTDVQDLLDGGMITHEHTLAEREDLIKHYRKEVALEAAPVLLTYRPQKDIDEVIKTVTTDQEPDEFSLNNQNHRLWIIRDLKLIATLKKAFEKISKVYVADGHHRLAAAADLQKDAPQWIMAMYVSTDKISIREFNRVVVPEKLLIKTKLFDELGQYFDIFKLNDPIPYRPGQLHHIGMHYKGTWYKLTLKADQKQLDKETDVAILQNRILNPIFNIKNPKTDPSLHSYPANQWEDLQAFSLENPNAVVFTLCPMKIDQLIDHAEQKINLPPKSTFIEPKIPYGLLLYCEPIVRAQKVFSATAVNR